MEIAKIIVDLFVAIGTIAMAGFTYWLGRKTSVTSESTKSLAEKTREMAIATADLATASQDQVKASMELAKISREAIIYENAPFLKIEIWIENRRAHSGQTFKAAVAAKVTNIGKGPAIGCQIVYCEKDGLAKAGQDIPRESVILACSEPFSLGVGETYDNTKMLTSYFSDSIFNKFEGLLYRDDIAGPSHELGAVICQDIFNTRYRFFTDASLAVDQVVSDQENNEGNPIWSYDPNIRNLTLGDFLKTNSK
jgi:hypothetical protein